MGKNNESVFSVERKFEMVATLVNTKEPNIIIIYNNIMYIFNR